MTNENMKELIKESVREVLKEERLALYEILIPSVTKKELKEIHQLYGKPDDYQEMEFIDMTEWIKNEDKI